MCKEDRQQDSECRSISKSDASIGAYIQCGRNHLRAIPSRRQTMETRSIYVEKGLPGEVDGTY